MDLNDLKIKELKQLLDFLRPSENSSMLQAYVGKYVIVRSSNEGINAGFVEELDETGIILSRARRIWYHKPKDRKTSWYEGVSVSGLSDDSKISCEVDKKVIVEKYSCTLCTKEAEMSIVNKETYEQN